MIIDRCQRWKDRRSMFRLVGDRFDPARHSVDIIERNPAIDFVTSHHYSGTFPTNRLNVGIFRGRRLAGVATFSVPARGTIPLRAGLPDNHGVELGRFVLLDEVEANAETWFLARAFEALRKEIPELRAVVSFSDPVKRMAADGRIVLPGHVGTIYQAFNGRYVGKSKSRTMRLGADGREVPPRAITKLRNGERGDDRTYARLIEMGAPARKPLEDTSTWIDRALASSAFRSFKHPGCHCYVWALDRTARKALPEAKPYPKAIAA